MTGIKRGSFAPLPQRAIASRMLTMPLSYYIYYRVQPGNAAACEQAIRSVLSSVRETTGIAGRLMKKRGEPNLWMEVYEGVMDGAKFEWELAEAAGRHGILAFLLPGSGRHVECFEE
jgi:hypothetical protein